MAVVELPVAHATWVDQSAPNANYYRKTAYLRLRSTAGTQARGILWFPSPFTAEGGNVASAKLRIRTRALPAGSHQIGVQLAGAWPTRFGSVHWANQPGVTGTVSTLSRSGAQAAGALWEIDVTSQMQQVASGQPFYGFVITGSTPDANGILVEGNYSQALNPWLVVDWGLAPQKPSALSPSGGRLVGVTNPTLRGDFRDVAGATSMLALQVQVATSSSGFGAPVYDSGTVLTSWVQHTPPAGTFPAGVMRWWRLRVQDTAGLWSAWSDPAQTGSLPLPVVTITNPPSVTNDPTPPVTATASLQAGRTIESWRAALYVDRGRGWVLHDHSGYRLTSELLWTPTKYLPQGVPVRAVFDVFDDADREATTGSPTHGTGSQDFTYSATATVPGVYALTAATRDGVATLTWSRAEAPDEWYIARDGLTLARVTGASLSIGGGRYRLADTLSPGGEHTWKVWAIVNRKSSPSGAVTKHVPRVGVWLVDPDNPTDQVVLSGTAFEQGMPDTKVVLEPIGAPAPVTITTALGGQRGTMDGTLTDGIGDPKRMRDLLLRWRPLAARGKQFQLLAYDYSFPVEVSGIYVGGDEYGGGGKWFAAGFQWVQVGDFPHEGL